MPPTHTIVICTKNRTDGVGDSIESALANPDCDVVVVDQNPDDRIPDVLAELTEGGRVHLIRTPIAGAGRARNLGLAAATTEIVCFTDDDCVVPSDYAERISAPLRDDPSVGLAFCTVAQAADSDTPGYAPLFNVAETRVIREWASDLHPEKLGIGAGMALRKPAAQAVGGFDPWMGPGGRFPSADDRELALRLLLGGHGVMDIPEPVVQHYGLREAGSAARALTKRDFLAMGGMLAKFVKTRTPHSARTTLSFLLRLMGGAVATSVRQRRITEFGKPWWSLVGVARGMRAPIDRDNLVYDYPSPVPHDVDVTHERRA